MDEVTLRYAMEGINSQLDDIKTSLKEIKDAQVQHPIICPIKDDVKTLEARAEKVENRVAAIEKWRWLVTGAAAASGGILGTLFANLVKVGGA